jgi:hypothetical protein
MSPINDSPLGDQLAWIQRNSRALTVAATAVLVVILTGFLVVRSRQIKSQRAEEAYGAAQQALFTGDRNGGMQRLAEVALRYAGTGPGALAALKLAGAHLEDGRKFDAIKVLEETQGKATAKVFGAAFHAMMGAAWSDSGSYAAAASEYVKAAEASVLENEKAAHMYRAAEMYARANDRVRAVEVLGRIVDGPPSEIRARARRLSGELAASSAKSGGAG